MESSSDNASHAQSLGQDAQDEKEQKEAGSLSQMQEDQPQQQAPTASAPAVSAPLTSMTLETAASLGYPVLTLPVLESANASGSGSSAELKLLGSIQLPPGAAQGHLQLVQMPGGVQGAVMPIMGLQALASLNGRAAGGVGGVGAGGKKERKKRQRAQVKTACINCRMSKVACEDTRPCKRCLRRNIAETCMDIKHRKRGRKTGPREEAALLIAMANNVGPAAPTQPATSKKKDEPSSSNAASASSAAASASSSAGPVPPSAGGSNGSDMLSQSEMLGPDHGLQHTHHSHGHGHAHPHAHHHPQPGQQDLGLHGVSLPVGVPMSMHMGMPMSMPTPSGPLLLHPSQYGHQQHSQHQQHAQHQQGQAGGQGFGGMMGHPHNLAISDADLQAAAQAAAASGATLFIIPADQVQRELGSNQNAPFMLPQAPSSQPASATASAGPSGSSQADSGRHNQQRGKRIRSKDAERPESDMLAKQDSSMIGKQGDPMLKQGGDGEEAEDGTHEQLQMHGHMPGSHDHGHGQDGENEASMDGPDPMGDAQLKRMPRGRQAHRQADNEDEDSLSDRDGDSGDFDNSD